MVDNLAYVTEGYSSLQVIDVSTPSSPKLVGSYNPTDHARGIFVDGNLAFVTELNSGLLVIKIDDKIRLSGKPAISDEGILNLKAIASDGADEVSTPFSIEVSEPLPVVNDFQVLGMEDTGLTFNATDFEEHFNDFDEDSLEKIQIVSLPSNGLLKLSSFNVTVGQEIDLLDIDNLIFDPEVNWFGGTNFGWKGYGDNKYSARTAVVKIQIEPVNDTPPIVIGTIANQTATYSQAFEMEFLKKSIFDDLVDGIDTLDITVKQANDADLPSWLSSKTISSLNLIETYNTPYSASGVYVVGDLAYVADGNSGLQIIDVSNPSNPSLVGTYDTPGYAHEVFVVSNLAFVADGLFGLHIIDVSIPSNPSLVKTCDTPASAKRVFVDGDLAFVSDETFGLQIIDVSVPSSPSLIGNYDTSSYAYGAYVVGNLAFVADKYSGLQVIDVSTPSNPGLVGAYNTSGWAYGVHVVGNYAYVADHSAGLQVIDVSTPSSPSLVGTCDTPGFANGVYVVDNLAYVADGSSGLQVIDVSVPSNPVLVETCDAPSSARKVFVVDGYAYVADGSAGLRIIKIDEKLRLGGTPSVPSDVGILNLKAIASDGFGEVSTPFSINVLEPPPIVNDFQILGVEDIDLTFNATDFKNHFSDVTGDDLEKIQIMSLPPNGLLKFASSNVTVGQEVGVSNIGNLTFSPILDWNGQTSFIWKGYGDGKYSNGTANVNIVITNSVPVISDVFKPGLEDIVLTFNATDFTTHFTDIDGDSLTKIQITSLPSNGILKLSETPVILNQEVNIGDLGNLTFVPTLDWSGVTNFTWKGYDGAEYSVIPANVNIQINNVNDPPTVIGTIANQTAYCNQTFEMDFATYLTFEDLDGDPLNVTVKQANNANLPSWLTYNINPVGSLILTGNYDGGGRAVYVVGNYAYVTDGFGGLKIVDVSIPSNPNLVGTCDTPELAYGVHVVGNLAYVADRDSGLQIIDVSTPSSPSIIGSCSTPGRAYGVYVVGNYAYVADNDSGLQIIDVSNPLNPSIVGSCSIGWVSAVHVIGNLAYAAVGSGLQIVDVSIPSSPSSIGYCETGDALGVYVVGNLAFIVAGSFGLRIIDISTPSNPNIVGTCDHGIDWAGGVYVVGDYAYIADSDGLRVIDVSIPSNPNLVGAYDCYAEGVCVVGAYAYVSRGGSLQIINIDEAVQIGGMPLISDVGILSLKAVASDGVDSVSAPFSINVLEPPPIVSGFQVLGIEDTNLTFNATDFKTRFRDFTGDSLEKIQIVNLPPHGVLKLSSFNVTAGQEIDISDVENLIFSPMVDWNGYTNFGWKGYGDSKYSVDAAIVNIQIDPVNDAPPMVVSTIANRIAYYNQTFEMDFLKRSMFADSSQSDHLF